MGLLCAGCVPWGPSGTWDCIAVWGSLIGRPLKQRPCWQVVRVMSAELMHANGTNGAIQGVTHERLGQAL